VVDEPQICVDEPAASAKETGAEGSVDLNGAGSIQGPGSTDETGAEASVDLKGADSTDEASATRGGVSEGEQSSTDSESPGSTDELSTDPEFLVTTDESIISTADLRDVFNRLEVIVQKLARGGAVW
jgi:hypothetical protein